MTTTTMKMVMMMMMMIAMTTNDHITLFRTSILIKFDNKWRLMNDFAKLPQLYCSSQSFQNLDMHHAELGLSVWQLPPSGTGIILAWWTGLHSRPGSRPFSLLATEFVKTQASNCFRVAFSSASSSQRQPMHTGFRRLHFLFSSASHCFALVSCCSFLALGSEFYNDVENGVLSLH